MNKKSTELYIQNEELLRTYIKNGSQKFLVDNMLQKLAFQLRNIGIDTAFVGDEIKSGKDKIKIAEEEDRIVLTKSKQIMLAKKVCPLIKIIGGKTDDQLRQVIKICEIKINKEQILGRCVKCNNPKLVCIEFEEAMEHLKWEETDGQEETAFFKCPKCLQIFWEGGMFDRAKKKFNALGEWSIDLPRSNKPIIEGKKHHNHEPKTHQPDSNAKKSINTKIAPAKSGTTKPKVSSKPKVNSKPTTTVTEKASEPVDGDSRVNLGAVNLTNIIDMVKSEILAEVEKGREAMKKELKEEILAELMKEYNVTPKQETVDETPVELTQQPLV